VRGVRYVERVKAPSVKPPETTTLEQQLDAAPRIITPSTGTAPPSEERDPWSIESQLERDVAIVSAILKRYAQRRDKIELRGNRTIGIGELLRRASRSRGSLPSVQQRTAQRAGATALARLRLRLRRSRRDV
jgi:hypothetical protein